MSNNDRADLDAVLNVVHKAIIRKDPDEAALVDEILQALIDRPTS